MSKLRLAIVTRAQFLADVYRYFDMQKQDTYNAYAQKRSQVQASTHRIADRLERMCRQEEPYTPEAFTECIRSIIKNEAEVADLTLAMNGVSSGTMPDNPSKISLTYWCDKYIADPRKYIRYVSMLDWSVECKRPKMGQEVKCTAKIQVQDEIVKIQFLDEERVQGYYNW